MLRKSHNARRYNEPVTLLLESSSEDGYGHSSVSEPEKVLDCFAYVRQMSAAKTAMTFQIADVIGLEIELRKPAVPFNLIGWRGHTVHFAQPEDADMRGRTLKIQGWYQVDDPRNG